MCCVVFNSKGKYYKKLEKYNGYNRGNEGTPLGKEL